VKDEVLYQGARWALVAREDHSRAGRSRRREVVVHPGSVVLLPLLDDGRVVLIRNERVSVGRALIELAAGTMAPNEPPLACAQRELIEETGYEARSIEPLLSFFIGPGVSDERMHAFVARGLTAVGQKLEDDERIVPFACAWDECLAMVRDGRIEDSKSIAVLLYWATYGGLRR
jgi:ADP-ribose pyrophosphatase